MLELFSLGKLRGGWSAAWKQMKQKYFTKLSNFLPADQTKVHALDDIVCEEIRLDLQAEMANCTIVPCPSSALSGTQPVLNGITVETV